MTTAHTVTRQLADALAEVERLRKALGVVFLCSSDVTWNGDHPPPDLDGWEIYLYRRWTGLSEDEINAAILAATQPDAGEGVE